MFFWYKLLSYLFYPFAYFFLFLRKLKKKEHHLRFKEKLCQTNFGRESGFLIWFHVASVGEAMSILPLVENSNLVGLTSFIVGGLAMLIVASLTQRSHPPRSLDFNDMD